MQKRYGMSDLFISHDLAVARAMAHQVLVMKDGVIVEAGKVETLFNAPQTAYTQALLAVTPGV